ncbi:hypothetical protein P7K49_025310 [Saguinus oedipus]|uniref:Uncharacterized protein n=1 Tax=Saguinus oedipus TaxID=9490 RepID=A0ABQ9UHA4_SAGOE|nr:hypothetical protein P7K49_025310 [Saguinus oedipus]
MGVEKRRLGVEKERLTPRVPDPPQARSPGRTSAGGEKRGREPAAEPRQRRSPGDGHPLPPAAALRCGAHGHRRLLFRLGRLLRSPAPFPRLRLTLTDAPTAAGRLLGAGAPRYLPSGIGAGARRAGCRLQQETPGSWDAASSALRGRRVIGGSPPRVPDPGAGTASAPSPPPPPPSGLGRSGGCVRHEGREGRVPRSSPSAGSTGTHASHPTHPPGASSSPRLRPQDPELPAWSPAGELLTKPLSNPRSGKPWRACFLWVLLTPPFLLRGYCSSCFL